jgi:hypothetical protein
MMADFLQLCRSSSKLHPQQRFTSIMAIAVTTAGHLGHVYAYLQVHVNTFSTLFDPG